MRPGYLLILVPVAVTGCGRSGPLAEVATPGALPVTADPINIGTKTLAAPAADHLRGDLDEVRVAPIAAGAAWAQVFHRNRADTLVVLSAPEEVGR